MSKGKWNVEDIEASYNNVDALNCDHAAVWEGEAILFELLKAKRVEFSWKKEKDRKKALESKPDLMDEIQYEEEIVWNMSKTTPRYRFRKIAEKYGLFYRQDGLDIRGDLMIVSAIARKSQQWFKGGNLARSENPMPLWAVKRGGRQSSFLLSTKASHILSGSNASNEEMLKGLTPGSRLELNPYDPPLTAEDFTENPVVGQPPPQVGGQSHNADAAKVVRRRKKKELTDAQVAAEHARLVLENNRLKAQAETVILPPAPTVPAPELASGLIH